MSSSAAVLKDPSISLDEDQHIIPKNRLGIVFFGLMCTTFLAALDLTIVATALPSIVAEIGAGNNYSWVGSAYMLASAALGPLYGKFSDLLGRKVVLYTCIAIFLVGSALCGAAQNMTWLIVCRAVQGIGCGGIMLLVQIITADLVPLKERGKYAGILGTSWGIASVTGPLVGGALAQHVSWRWCFWINLPIGGAAGVILFFFLNLNPHQGRSFHEHVKDFDFIGLIAIVSGVVCLLLGFNASETSWKSAETISLLVVGGILIVIFGFNEMYTTQSAILPQRLFKTCTTGIILFTVFLQAFVFFVGAYYLPMYYQVLGASPTMSGVKTLPYCLGTAMSSALSGILLARTGWSRPIVWCSWTLMTIGWGLMFMLDNKSSIATQEIYPLITALGAGPLLQTPLIALQAAMPQKDVATSTGTSGFLCILGGAIGIAIGETIITSALQQRLKDIPGLIMGTSVASINNSITKIASIPDISLRNRVMHDFTRSISMVWLVNTPLSAFGLFLVFFIRAYSLNRKVIREGAEKVNNAEKGEMVESAGIRVGTTKK